VPTALITGATAGLGATFARHLAAEGYDLVIVARDRSRLEERRDALQERHSVSVEVLAADLATPAGVGTVAARIAAGATDVTPTNVTPTDGAPTAVTPIDVLVNNAGIGIYRPFGVTDIDDEQRLLDLNVTAVMRLTHAAVRAMQARATGTIINVASVSGFVPRPATVSYGASKAYVIAFTEALSARLAGTGVTATVVCPGFVHTEFHARAQVDPSFVPDWMWLDADAVVSVGLADARKGKPVSIPALRYKALVGVSRVAGRRVGRRFGAAGGPRPTN
jgi:short-subunit dehydrogenase